MLIYTLEVTLCWAAGLLLYHVLLCRETFFRMNRWHLLATALFGLLIPAIEFAGPTGAVDGSPMVQYFQPITSGAGQLEAILVTASAQKNGFDWFQFLTWVYITGAALSLARFGHGLRQIFRLYRMGEKEQAAGYRFVSTEAGHAPFSFFKNLFWSKNFQTNAADREYIMRHEEAHIFQWHSLDVVLVEILGVVFWCSPLIYFLQKAMKTNHEYLADEAVLRYTGRKNYGQLLLRQFQPAPQVALSNSLFSSQIKNRIVMMTKNKSPKSASLKYLAGLPIMALLFLAFSFAEGEKNRPNVPDESPHARVVRDTSPEDRVYKEVDELPCFRGCEDIADAEEREACTEKEMLTFIYTTVKYPEEAQKNEVEGMVVVNFIIEKDGTVAEAEILRSIGGGCDEEVLRVVNAMPKWTPGKQDGKPVRVEYNLPVRFKLEPGAKSEKPKTDEMPFFVSGCENMKGGLQKECAKQALFGFIGQNLKYPETAKKQGIEGMVVAGFTIEEDGALTDPAIEKGLDPDCDAEVLRVLKAMPKWAPGRKDGKAVAVEMKLPFKFVLPGEERMPAWSGEAENLAKKVEVFKVFPNPATDQVSVAAKAEAGPVTILLTNLEGKKLASMDFENDGHDFSAIFRTDKMPRGAIYVSLVRKGGEVLETETIVLQ